MPRWKAALARSKPNSCTKLVIQPRMLPGMTCSPTSKDTTIVSGSIPPSGISPPNRQSAKPLDPVSTKSAEGHCHVRPFYLLIARGAQTRMSKCQCLRMRVAELNRLENRLFLANVTMPVRVTVGPPSNRKPDGPHAGAMARLDTLALTWLEQASHI